MPTEKPEQPPIFARLDYTLAQMRLKGMVPRAIYLNATDDKAFQRAASKQTGGPVVRLQHEGVPIISRTLDERFYKDVPVRTGNGKAKDSRVWSNRGVAVNVYKVLPNGAA